MITRASLSSPLAAQTWKEVSPNKAQREPLGASGRHPFQPLRSPLPSARRLRGSNRTPCRQTAMDRRKPSPGTQFQGQYLIIKQAPSQLSAGGARTGSGSSTLNGLPKGIFLPGRWSLCRALMTMPIWRGLARTLRSCDVCRRRPGVAEHKKCSRTR